MAHTMKFSGHATISDPASTAETTPAKPKGSGDFGDAGRDALHSGTSMGTSEHASAAGKALQEVCEHKQAEINAETPARKRERRWNGLRL